MQLLALLVVGQMNVTVPLPSPEAAVEQTVGLTKLRVVYHRPAVDGRKVWGELVPYDQVWRAGANENTTLSVSSPMSVGGKQIPAGTYGVHMIPTAKTWTVILSNMAIAWGSYTYDIKEDAARATVTPRAGPHQERVAFTFENVTEKSADLVMHWDKLEVPLHIDVDTVAVTMAHMRGELRGAHNFVAQAWQQAAAYWLAHGGDLDEATTMADRSLRMRESFEGYLTRAAIADKKGDAKLAASMRQKGDALATEADLNVRGYELMGEKKLDEALVYFRKNVQLHADSSNAHDSLGEALAAKGDKPGAVASYKKALALTKDEQSKKRIEQVIAQLQK